MKSCILVYSKQLRRLRSAGGVQTTVLGSNPHQVAPSLRHWKSRSICVPSETPQAPRGHIARIRRRREGIIDSVDARCDIFNSEPLSNPQPGVVEGHKAVRSLNHIDRTLFRDPPPTGLLELSNDL